MSWTIVLSVLLTITHAAVLAQQDTTTHGWPVTPFFATHPSTGVFCEFRNTLTADHFHNGTDIPAPDGTSVYPVHDGVITAIGTVSSSGDNAYVRIRYYGDVVWSGKTDAYVHIAPNPNLVVGDPVFAHSTVLGTILPGLGHVHFTNGPGGAEINALRPFGGFSPFTDIYAPKILSIRFFVDETETELLNGRVSGRVDIRAHIAEPTAGDASALTGSTMNNGTYVAGYKILSADASQVVYAPPDEGVRFRFDSMPVNGDVHRVYATGSDLSNHIYSITNGAGAASVNASRSVDNNAWNTGMLPEGNYIVMAFAQDTRFLADTEYVPVRVVRGDFVPPAVPVLRFVGSDSTNRIRVSWYKNTDPDLAGYRLFFTSNSSDWVQKESEEKLTRESTSISYTLTTGTIYFKLAAIDSSAPPNVSGFSDVYGVRLTGGATTASLIVDGFDRVEVTGSYHAPSHPFAMVHGFSVPGDFNTCSNDAIIDGSVSLRKYPVVDWLLGDESVTDTTFTATEQALIVQYLQNGGKLFASGSDIAYDLDRPSGPVQSSRDFAHLYMKIWYGGDSAAEANVAGLAGTAFQGARYRFGVVAEGSPYQEDSPDYYLPVAGGVPLLTYGSGGTGLVAAVGSTGIFPGGTENGGVVTCGFPFETITSRAARDSLMKQVFDFFGTVTHIDTRTTAAGPLTYGLEQNYPNPFNPETAVIYQLPATSRVRVSVFDLLGRDVTTLVDGVQEAGRHSITWNASNMTSGVYFCRMTAGGFAAVRKMMVLK